MFVVLWLMIREAQYCLELEDQLVEVYNYNHKVSAGLISCILREEDRDLEAQLCARAYVD